MVTRAMPWLRLVIQNTVLYFGYVNGGNRGKRTSCYLAALGNSLSEFGRLSIIIVGSQVSISEFRRPELNRARHWDPN